MSTITGRAESRETIDAAKSPGAAYQLNMVLFDRASKVKVSLKSEANRMNRINRNTKQEQVFFAHVSHLMGYDGFEFGDVESSSANRM